MYKATEDRLNEKIETYFQKFKPEFQYPLEEEGIFKIVGGVDWRWIIGGIDCRKRIEDSLVKGRFIDVFVHAINQPEFYGTWTSKKNLSKRYHGYIKKLEIKELPKLENIKDTID